MPERMANFLNSKIVDLLVKVSVPMLLGMSGYFFSFILDTTSRIAVIENSRFTATDGRALQDRVAVHDSQLMLLDANQKRVISVLDKVTDNQTIMLQAQSRIEANISELKER